MQIRTALRAAAALVTWFASSSAFAHSPKLTAPSHAERELAEPPPSAAVAAPVASPAPSVDPDDGDDAVAQNGNSGVRAALGTAAASTSLDAQEGEDELTLDEWERDEWNATRPRVALFDVAGYYRVRGDLMRRLDFGNDATWEQALGTRVPRACPHPNGKTGGFNQLSMRLRVHRPLRFYNWRQEQAGLTPFSRRPYYRRFCRKSPVLTHSRAVLRSLVGRGTAGNKTVWSVHRFNSYRIVRKKE